MVTNYTDTNWCTKVAYDEAMASVRKAFATLAALEAAEKAHAEAMASVHKAYKAYNDASASKTYEEANK